ncbi:MAG: lysophospholipid acyltransferase family protein [Acidobacteriaceae bacterium]|nr:lysophospholipid acyltransferase family protein [Acidobacteriaceae bacterium]
MQNSMTALFGDKVPAAVQGALQRVLLVDLLHEIHRASAVLEGAQTFPEKLLRTLNVRTNIQAWDVARIPKNGPALIVANHPFGLIEGVVLAALLSRYRPDFKIVTNFLLAEFDELRTFCIFVDPFGRKGSAQSNRKGMRECLAWLKRGGTLAVFPAGEVAHLDLKQRNITDPTWSETVAKLARLSGAPVVPMYFDGNNSALFHLLGLIHPRLRTAMLPHEFLNKRHAWIEVRAGNVIPPKKFSAFSSDEALIRHFRQRTYLLKNRGRTNLRKLSTPNASKAVAAAVGPEILEQEIQRLPTDRTVAELAGLSALLARAHEIPETLREIGRLREITFRETGEGTGRAIDIDAFDDHYLHLFVWNAQRREIVGAYRLGPVDEIIARFGSKGLYTNTLFRYKREFLTRIGPALELGRSFVRSEYQKNFAPLLLLWKGIAQFVANNPRYKVLFGPVSISNDYTPASRQLMVTYLKSHNQADNLSRLVKARSPFHTKPIRELQSLSEDMIAITEWDIEDLSALIADIESEHKGVPILLKQYLKLGGKLVAFNLDSNFSDALDGLIVVDLTETDSQVLDRYMGRENAVRFLAHHRRLDDKCPPT